MTRVSPKRPPKPPGYQPPHSSWELLRRYEQGERYFRDLRWKRFTQTAKTFTSAKDCDFSGADFGQADFRWAFLEDCWLNDANLSNCRNLNVNKLPGCDLTGAQLPGSHQHQEKELVQRAGRSATWLAWAASLFAVFLLLSSGLAFATPDRHALVPQPQPLFGVGPELSYPWLSRLTLGSLWGAVWVCFAALSHSLQWTALPWRMTDGQTVVSLLKNRRIQPLLARHRPGRQRSRLHWLPRAVLFFCSYFLFAGLIYLTLMRLRSDTADGTSLLPVFLTLGLFYAPSRPLPLLTQTKRAWAVFVWMLVSILCVSVTTLVVDTDKLRGALFPWKLANSDLQQVTLIGGWSATDVRAEVLTLGDRTFTRVDLSSADLQAASLQEARLLDVNFSGANLSHANLQDARLFSIELDGAKLHHTQFAGAHFVGVDLRATEGLTQKRLAGACADKQTQLPAPLQLPRCPAKDVEALRQEWEQLRDVRPVYRRWYFF